MCSLLPFRRRVLDVLGVTAVSSLILGFLVAAGSSRLLACDDGVTVPAPRNNPGLVADCKALLGLRDKLAGTAYLDWESGSPISGWHGITISGSPSRVSELKLTGSELLELRPGGNELTGRLPAELAQLTRLQWLQLDYNDVTGPIPPQLGELADLELLSIRQNRLRGHIPPELARLTKLERLTLGENRLSGRIPPEFGQLTSLKTLELDHNLLTGAIPPQLAKLTQLRRLFLSSNGLTGPIPPQLGEMPELFSLRLFGNYLTGPIPSELGQLAQLHTLTLSTNKLTGPIPPELANLTRLVELHLNDNYLTGDIPQELSRLTEMRWLWLNDNRLTGPIPPQLVNLTQLNWLLLNHNQLTGPIPPRLANLTHLELLRVDHNHLTGPIPPQFGRLTGMRWLNLSDNQLTGPIPPELGQLTQLQSLYLQENRLTGPIPQQLAQLTHLERLRLDNNRLTGSIPSRLARLVNLEWLYLDNNQLTGPIPRQFGQLTQLQRLFLNHNRLTGQIPTELARLGQLQWLHLDNNRLTGPIPAELAELSQLQRLHLQNNQLTGTIPDELGRLSNLKQFSYRGNPLTGPLPPGLRHLPDLYVLNLAARWVGPDRMRVTWDDPGVSNASYKYRFWVDASLSWTGAVEVPATDLKAGEGSTIESVLTGLPTDIDYTAIGLQAQNDISPSPEVSAPVQPMADHFCLSLWDRTRCATTAVLPHVFVGPLGVNTAEAEILMTNRDPDHQSCEMALLFHRGRSVAPEILFDDRPMEGNLVHATLPRGGARILTLAADSEELVVGAVSVFVRSPCSVDSLRVHGRYLVEKQVNADIQEVFSVSGQSPQEWLGDGDCHDITGVFGTGRDLGFASVTAEPGRRAPAGTRLHFRAFDLKGKPTAESPGSLEITGEHTASFPWKFQDPTILEMCLDVPEENSDFEISTIAIGIVQKGENVQWSDEVFTPIDSQEVPSALSDSGP